MLSLAHSALRRPVWWLLGCFAVLATVGGLGLPRLVIDTDGAALDNPRDPVVVAAREDRLRFDDPEQAVLLVLARPGGPGLTSREGLAFVAELDRQVRRLPAVHAAGVRSLADLRELRISATELSAEPILAQVPADGAELSAVLDRLAASPWAEPALLARDGRAAAIAVPLAADGERHELIAGLRGLAASAAPFEVLLLGPLVAEISLGEAVLADLGRLVPLSALVMAGLLAWRLRSLNGVVVPLATLLAVMIFTFGVMGLAGVPVTLVMTPLPVLLQALLLVEAIHFGERLAGRVAREGAADRPAALRLVGEVLAELERPLIATYLTTAIGFLSFLVTPLAALRFFGLFGALGVVSAMLASFTLAPALFAVLPPAGLRPIGGAGGRGAGRSRILSGVARWGLAGPLAVLVLVAAAGPLWLRLEVGDNWTANLAPDDPLVRADRAYNEHFWGSYRVDVVARGPEDLFATPEGLAWVQAIEDAARALPGVSGVLSHRTALGEVARAQGQAGADALDADEISDFLGLVEMSTDPRALRQFLSPDAAWARIQLFVKGEDFRRDRALVETLQARLAALPTPPGAGFHLSGDIPKGLAMVDAVVRGQVGSIALTYGVIGLLLFAVYPRGRGAVVVLVPVVATTGLLFAGMGLLAIPLGVATSMFGSLVAELGVDVGLHLVHGHRGAAPGRRGVEETLERIAPALTTAALVLSSGYAVLAISELRPNRSLGLLLASAIALTVMLAVVCFVGLGRWLGPNDKPAPALLGLEEEVA